MADSPSVSPFTRVLLVDDHTIVRAAIRMLLQPLAGIEVVGEAVDGHDALHQMATTSPDIVLMDIVMPRLNGLEATARIIKAFPHVRVLILSMLRHEAAVLHALQAGAAGYLLKDAAVAELELALRAVAGGEMYLSPPLTHQFLVSHLQFEETPAKPHAPLLTSRQREILQLIAEGYSTKAIASHLHVSARTVETHRHDLMTLLDIHNVAGLVRMGLVDLNR